jgi:hypothetical protein
VRTGLVRHGVVALALLGAAAGAVVGGAVRPLPAAAAGACPATVPAGQVRVVVVVDPGTEPGAPGPASVDCLVLPEGSTGSDLLRRRAERVGAAPPRYAPSGLLCAIDGYPAPPACGERTSTGYRYWSYWSGLAVRARRRWTGGPPTPDHARSGTLVPSRTPAAESTATVPTRRRPRPGAPVGVRPGVTLAGRAGIGTGHPAFDRHGRAWGPRR